MSEKIIKTENSHIQKRECEIDMNNGSIIACLSNENKNEKEDSE